MSVPLLIVVVSIFVWLFPPFTNRNTKYLAFFIILALSDPVRLFLFYTLKLNPLKLSAGVAVLALSSLVRNRNLRFGLIAISIATSIIFVFIDVPRSLLLEVSCFAHFLIIYCIVDSFIRHFSESHSINLFLTLLITYEFITILKYAATILSLEEGVISFYLATFIQIFFGILFTFINIDSKNFSVAREK